MLPRKAVKRFELFFTHLFSDSLSHSSTHSLTHSLTHARTHARTHTHSCTHPLTHTLTHSHTHTLTHTFTHALNHSLTHTLTHALTHSLTHSHTYSCIHMTLQERQTAATYQFQYVKMSFHIMQNLIIRTVLDVTPSIVQHSAHFIYCAKIIRTQISTTGSKHIYSFTQLNGNVML